MTTILLLFLRLSAVHAAPVHVASAQYLDLSGPADLAESPFPEISKKGSL